MADQQRTLTVVQMLPALESGGVERGTLEVARELVRRGHRSIVISAGGRLVEQLQDEGSEHLCWSVGAKRPGTLMWIPRIAGFLRRQRPDVLHLRSRLPAWVGYLAWKFLPEIERPHLVTTVHGPYSVNRYSAIMTQGKRIIAVSEMIREYVLNNYPAVDPDRIRVIHRGVDPEAYPRGYHPQSQWLYEWRAQFPQLRNQYVVTLPARLTRWKGQEHLVQVIADLRSRNIPAHGVLVGSAHPRKRHFEQELHVLIKTRGLSEHFTFTGHRGDLREIMAVSDVILSLSLEPEAFGRVTLEALALGRPVAAYDHGGVAEQLAVLLPEGRIPVGDKAALTKLLTRWYQSPPQVNEYNPFTLQKMLNATLSVYHELVADRTSLD